MCIWGGIQNFIASYDIIQVIITHVPFFVMYRDVLQYLEDLKAGKVFAPASKPVSQVFIPVKPVQQVKQAPPPPKIKVQPVKSSSYVDIPVDGVKRSTAEGDVYSKWSTPYSYATVSCNVDRAMETKRKMEGKTMYVCAHVCRVYFRVTMMKKVG